MQQYSSGPRVDWGEALDVSLFYGRTSELALLARWVIQERCHIVSVLGMGGIGKSALAITFMHQMVSSFQAVVFRSVRNAPLCMDLLTDCLQILSPQPLSTVPTSIEQSIDLLLECFQTQHCLLVLDNLETLLQERDPEGRFRAGYEDYTTLLHRVAETPHQSCLLVTSRESIAELGQQESHQTYVRSLRLPGLESDACEQLFEERDVVGTMQDQMCLIQRYVGNPLALKIVTETITELFDGEIGPFLEQDTVIFSSIRDLLARQWTRLTTLEQALLTWLAIVREPREETDLHAMLVPPVTAGLVHQALEALHRRSLVEQGQQQTTFTLQSVVLEYVTEELVVRVSEQIQHSVWEYLISYALEQAGAREYVRQAQERLIITQILLRLQAVSRESDMREELLLNWLNQLRGLDQEAQGYGPTNLIMLLRRLRGHLRGLDLSHLSIRGGYLQGAEMQDTQLCGSILSETVFTEALHAIWAVTVSPTGKFWAAGSWRGEVRVWSEGGQRLHLVWQAHTDNAFTLAFSPDERILATGSWDSTVKLWDVQSGTLLWTGRHTNLVQSVAFSPDGRTLASGGDDTIIQLWDLPSGKPMQTLTSHGNTIYSLVWSPDGHMLACGGFDGCIRLWQLQRGQPATCVRTLVGHRNWVHSLAFAPDGTQLASGSWDNTVKLWDIASGRVLQTLTGHTQRIYSVAWSPDGHTLASASFDKTIWLWDVVQQRYRSALHGHTAAVYSLAFTPNSSRLLSGSEDSTIRVWDVDSGECVRILQGYAVCFYSIDWNPAGSHLVSGSTDGLVCIWKVAGEMSPRVLGTHHWLVHDVAWSPDGRWIASCGWDNVIRLWETTTGACLYALRTPEKKDTLFLGATWSPDGQQFASGSYLEGLHIWDVMEHRVHMVEQTSQIVFRDVAWSPDNTLLASGSNEGSVCLWDPTAGTLQQRLPGHQGSAMKVAWSPDGTRLASAGDSRSGGELLVWELPGGQCVRSFVGQPALVFAVAWDLSGALLVSGDSNGTLRWWNVSSGECLRVRQAHQGIIRALRSSPDGRWVASCGDDGAIRIWDMHSGESLRTLRRDRPYERLDITGIRGLTEAQKATLRALGAVEEASVNNPGILPA